MRLWERLEIRVGVEGLGWRGGWGSGHLLYYAMLFYTNIEVRVS